MSSKREREDEAVVPAVETVVETEGQPDSAVEEATKEGGDTTSTAPKAKKRKYCLWFGYVGEEYHGLQVNMSDDHPTIEAALLKGCHEAGLISKDNMDGGITQKTQWQRASRTDKGVHALRNIVSVKFQVPPDGEEACVKRLNEILPKDIRVYCLQPVTASFNSYLFCTGRKYDYYLPTYGLMNLENFKKYFPVSVAPEWPVSDDIVTGEPATGPAPRAAVAPTPEEDPNGEEEEEIQADGEESTEPKKQAEGSNMYIFNTIPDDVFASLMDYRLDQETLERSRRLFEKYCGTNMFHNFTPGGKSSNPSMHRYIRSVTVSDPFMHHDVEWVKISLDGQAFMLNQIRKMIGCVSVVLASGQKDSFIDECMEKKVKRGIPMAPANGLLLLALDFNRYNSGLEAVKSRSKGKCAPDKQCIYPDDEHHTGPEVESLRTDILTVIARKEREERIMSRWMRSVRHVVRLAWDIAV